MPILIRAVGVALVMVFTGGQAWPQDQPMLQILWPKDETEIVLGDDPERVVGVVVSSNYTLRPAGQCGGQPLCGHLHLKINPADDSCNIPGRSYNSMNSDIGGELIKARFGHCKLPIGTHVIGILLADDQHKPVLSGGKPVTALVRVTTKEVPSPTPVSIGDHVHRP